MSYHFSKTVSLPFEEAIERTKAVLKENGFGVLTEIDIQSTLKEKIGVDFRKYRILGACNPGYAHKALSSEGHIGLMLPCNVVVQEHENGSVEVSAIDPVASMQAVHNEALHDVAGSVQALLKKAIETV
jgi:uncharacterized protein (DUF302 family)